MQKLVTSLIALSFLAGTALAGDTIRIVGSSTVYPFTTAVAESFGKKSGFPTPIVESTGTGGGIKMFCEGEGPDTPSVVNASREIKTGEIELCQKNGVGLIEPFTIGIDAIVVAHAKEGGEVTLTVDDIYQALAQWIIVDGQFVENTHTHWNINSQDNVKIEVLGPPPTSGTRDSFVELVMVPACKVAIEKAGLTVSDDDIKKYCHSIRQDGAFVEAGENDNLIVQKIIANPNAFGIFGYSFLEENAATLTGASIDGVKPEYETIASGEYPVSRELYIYVKKAHYDVVPGLREFITEYIDSAIGPDGYLVDKGLVPKE